jgi:hypothetical protein
MDQPVVDHILRAAYVRSTQFLEQPMMEQEKPMMTLDSILPATHGIGHSFWSSMIEHSC